MAIVATVGHSPNAYASAAFLIAAAIFGYAGVAIVLRWRGWRIWAGTIAWCLVALVVLNFFTTPPPGMDTSFYFGPLLVTIAFAAFVLIAKRRERRPDFAAAFDD